MLLRGGAHRPISTYLYVVYVHAADWLNVPSYLSTSTAKPTVVSLCVLVSVVRVCLAGQISPGSTVEPPFAALMDMSEALASFQRFSRQEWKMLETRAQQG